MTTREDYEFAAKAAGLEIVFNSAEDLPYDDDGGLWNPEHDDGDSRRLEVACKMRVDVSKRWAYAELRDMHFCEGVDPCAATRAAVFRCAVEIGKRLMKGGE